MSVKDFNYKSVDRYVLRSTTFPIESYLSFTSENVISDNEYKNILSDDYFIEALFLASPVLIDQANKWVRGEIVDAKEIRKIKTSVLKYYTRMCCRCTPFGLFAGVSVGHFVSEVSSSILKSSNKLIRKSRLDMFFLAQLSRKVASDSVVKNKILFYPNTSIYEVGDSFRYIETVFTDSKRTANITSVDKTSFLSLVLEKSVSGLPLLELAKLLVDDDVTYEESKEFIDELVESQILVSELDPYVTGPAFLSHFIKVLDGISERVDILELLLEIDNKLKDLDFSMVNGIDKYNDLIAIIDKFDVPYKENLLFQVDLNLQFENNYLSDSYASKVLNAFDSIVRINQDPKETILTKFVEEFSSRFEKQTIPLGLALDVESGLGFGSYNQVRDPNPLINDLILPDKKEDLNTEVYRVSLFEKFLETKRKNADFSITLDSKNLDDFEILSNKYIKSFSVSGVFEIVEENGVELIKFSGAGGNSSSSIIGRFSELDQEIHDLCEEIIQNENDLLLKLKGDNYVFAEIAHLPKFRMGNVIHRPILREYEIPYLVNSNLLPDNQIKINDLNLRINSNAEFELFSERLKKIVLPRLACSHNYRLTDSDPIYSFLGEMQAYNSMNGFFVNFGDISKNTVFLPRIVFEDVILKEASWNFQNKDFERLIALMESPKSLLNEIVTFRELWKLPEFVKLVQGDNELLVRFTCYDSLYMLLKEVKSNYRVQLVEFLFPKGIVKDSDGNKFCHQINVSFILNS